MCTVALYIGQKLQQYCKKGSKHKKKVQSMFLYSQYNKLNQYFSCNIVHECRVNESFFLMDGYIAEISFREFGALTVW